MHLIHDLRLVLIATTACLSTAERRSTPQALPPGLDQARDLLETGRALVDEILVDRSLKPIAPHVDLNDVVRNLEGTLATIVGPLSNVRMTLDPGHTRVYGQRADVERILLNVAFNAAAAMPSGGSLWIQTEVVNQTADANSTPESVRLTMRDTGRGMSAAELRRVPDPAAIPRLDGTGLGLASVALIVTRLGGLLVVESRQYVGTIVSILLPLGDSPGAALKPGLE